MAANLSRRQCVNGFHSNHWGRVAHICVISDQAIICADNGLAPTRRQAIIWINEGFLFTRLLETYFRDMWIKIYHFWYSEMNWKRSSAKWRPFFFHWGETEISGEWATGFFYYGLNLIQVRISNHMPSKVWHRLNYLSIPKPQCLHRGSWGMDK